jgi:hypothetical protein
MQCRRIERFVYVNGKLYPRTNHKGPDGEWRYKSTLSFNLNLGAAWEWVVNVVLWPFYLPEGDPVTILLIYVS